MSRYKLIFSKLELVQIWRYGPGDASQITSFSATTHTHSVILHNSSFIIHLILRLIILAEFSLNYGIDKVVKYSNMDKLIDWYYNDLLLTLICISIFAFIQIRKN